MTQRCVRALARVLLLVAALATTAGVAALRAQATGKIQGYITDAQGQPIPNARVTVTGTAFSAPTNAQGYYFIENIPAGLISARAAYIGYQPKEVQGLRVLAGQTVTLNFTLEQQAVQLQSLTVVETAKNALVPRDQVSTKQDVTGDVVSKLPVDRISQALALQPGVTQVTNCSTNGAGNGSSTGLGCSPLISVRGGRVDQNAVYIDGVPVQPGIHTGQATGGGGSIGNAPGSPTVEVATNGFEEASITTGASSAAFGNGQASVISIATRTGGSKFAGSLTYETGLLGLAYYGQGVNIFAGSFGGPITKNLTFFVSGRLEGDNSSNGGNHGWLFPGYRAVGVDTTYRVAALNKASGTAGAVVDSADVSVYNYAVVEGGCNSSMIQKGLVSHDQSSFTPIANNYGVTCHANQGWDTPNTNYYTTDKLNWTFGKGSQLSASYIFTGNQSRGSLSDGTTTGNQSGANIATLSWNQTIIREATHQLTLDAYISRQWSNFTSAPLTTSSESSTRHSAGGFILNKLKFQYGKSDYPVDSVLLMNILSNNKSGHRIGITDPINTSQYNGLGSFTSNSVYLPPDGIGYSAGGGGGGGLGLTYRWEDRTIAHAAIDLQADRYNRIKIGGERTWYAIQDYGASTSGAGVFPLSFTCGEQATQTTLPAGFTDGTYCKTGQVSAVGHPVAYDAYAEDRLDLGDVVLVGGLRYDYYDTKAWRWNEYPEISSRPGYIAPSATTGLGSLFCAPGAQPSSTALCSLVQDPSHNYVSPHVQVSFPVNDQTNFRLSYAQNVQAPDFGLIYDASLFDINVSGQNQRGRWGQDLDFGKTIAFEFGARHAFSDDMVLDVAVYNDDIVANPSFGFEHPIDPVTQNANIIYLVSNKDFGNTRGIDVRLDRRIGNYFNGSISYSFQDSKNTGTDPFAYLGFFEPLSSFTGQPATAALTTGISRPHSLTAVFNLQLPGDWKKGTVLGAILHRTGFFVTSRIASGLAYTRCVVNPTSPGTISGGTCPTTNGEALSSEYNGARLPMYKQLDLRATRNFRLGRYDFTAYLDARNILGIRNITGVYAQTGTTTNLAAVAQRWQSDSVNFRQFGSALNWLQSDGSIKLPTTTAACGTVANGSNSFAPECYYYIRSEQRFGNGDGIYTLAEQRAASNSNNAVANSVYSSNFTTGARTIRFGLEVDF